MPQLPSVSELMVGAHFPVFGGHTDLKHHLQHLKRSDTTPRRLESYMTLPYNKQQLVSPSHQLEYSGHLTPPTSAPRTVTSVSPQGSVVMPSLLLPGSSGRPVGAPNTSAAFPRHPGAILGPYGQSFGDYFSYRNTSAPPQHYSMYKRAGLMLLLLESMLRMALVTTIVPRVGLSPALPLTASYNFPDRLGLFLQESTTRVLHSGGPLTAYPTPMGPILYTQSYVPCAPQAAPQVTPQAAPQAAHQTNVRASGGSATSIAPASYGLPPLGNAVIQPYGVLIPSHYGLVVVGPSQVDSRSVPEVPVQQAAEQNYALINKRRIIKRRTRTGCLTCRKRRIKCDERKPHCFNCERLKKLCLGYEALPSNTKRRNLEDDSKPVPHRSSVHDLL